MVFASDEALRQNLDHYTASRWMLERELRDHAIVKALAFEIEALEALSPAT